MKLQRVRYFILVLATLVCAGCMDQPEIAESDRHALRATMNRFVAALSAGNTTALAGFFPREGKWRLQSSLGVADAQSLHTRDEVRRSLDEREGLFDTLIEGDGDTLRDYAKQTGARQWPSSGPLQFSPPNAFDSPPQLFVKWRQERGRWVIDAIGVPFA